MNNLGHKHCLLIFIIVLCVCSMMFNGLMMCSDSDCSDYFKGSSGAPSVAGSGGGGSGAERARCLRDKLHATLQILKNKEETVRVQAESLALAEARISALAARASPRGGLTRDLFQKDSGSECKVEMTDVSINTQTQEEDTDLVNTLKDNLSVVEDLYRRSFYESARQEQTIEALRRSCLELRRAERGRGAPAAHTSYQDIALEVDNLKAEISNFLDDSNNDSGVWEQAADCDVADELRHIAAQLHRLRDLISAECTCGLDEDNKRLIRANEINETLIGELRQRISDLEGALGERDGEEGRYQREIAEKEHELNLIRQQLIGSGAAPERACCCERAALQLERVQELLNEKTSELVEAQRRCDRQEGTIRELRVELDRADGVIKERSAVREEVAQLTAQVAAWRAQLEGGRQRLRRLELQLQRARRGGRRLAALCEEKTDLAYELQNELEEAHSRGAELCEEARRAVCAVRRCLLRRDPAPAPPGCSRCGAGASGAGTSGAGASGAGASGASGADSGASGPAASPPEPPPRRLLRKKSSAADVECRWTPESTPVRVCSLRDTREASSAAELLARVERAHDALEDARRRWGRSAPPGPQRE